MTQNTTNYDNTKLSTVQGTNINNPNFVRMSDGNVSPAIYVQGDNDISLNMLGSNSRGQLFNGSSWDRQRGNIETLNLLTSGARTGNIATALQANHNCRGVYVVLKVTGVGATGGLKVIVRDRNAIWLTSQTANITAIGNYGFMFYPGIVETNSATPSSGGVTWKVNGALPRSFDVLVSHADGTSYTYSLDINLIL